MVERIEDVVERGVPDQFLGLILLPLVEKAAEHLTAIDEAWDGQIVSAKSNPICRQVVNKYNRILRSSTA
jgi:Ca2+/H+ antiporter